MSDVASQFYTKLNGILTASEIRLSRPHRETPL